MNKELSKTFFELSEGNKQKLKSTAEVILTILGIAGLVAVSVIAPNVLQIMKGLSNSGEYRQRFSKSQIENKKQLISSISSLKHRGYIRIEQKKSGLLLYLTEKGKKRLNKINWNNYRVGQKGKWNGHWWLVLADVPSAEFRYNEDAFRKKLKQMGFYRLQKSVWMYPFDPRAEIDYVSQYFDIGKYVTVMEVINLDPSDKKFAYDYFKEKGVI